VTTDPLLKPLLAAAADEADAILEVLVTDALHHVAVPILRGLVQQDPADVFDELRADIGLRLVSRLRTIVREGEAGIASFRDYAAVVTYHAFDDSMRRRFPRRARLKNRIRYVLDRDYRFTLSNDDRGAVVSLLPSGGRPVTKAVAALGDACAAVLEAHGRPMLLDPLVTAVAEALGEVDVAPVALETRPDLGATGGGAERLEGRDYLRCLWREIVDLPLRQRTALLLNLREEDGAAAVRLLPSTGIASISDIAVALELAPRALAAIWNGLPLPDAEIAQRLGITRQQVINLRKSARQRLARRMARVR